jgi:hypothetical protein
MPLIIPTPDDLQLLRNEYQKMIGTLSEQLQSLTDQVNKIPPPVVLPPVKLPQIEGFSFWNFPADIGAPKLTSTTETAVGLTFTTSTHTVAQYEDQLFARPDRMALDLVTLGKGSVDFLLYAWSADQSVNAAQFSSTPTLKLIKQVNMTTDIDNHRYHKYFSLTQDEIDILMSVTTKYGLVLGLRYKAQPACLMSSLNATVLTSYKI